VTLGPVQVPATPAAEPQHDWPTAPQVPPPQDACTHMPTVLRELLTQAVPSPTQLSPTQQPPE